MPLFSARQRRCLQRPHPCACVRVRAWCLRGLGGGLGACIRAMHAVDFFGCGQPSVAGEMQSFAPPAMDDGMLEVVGTNGVGHLMATKLGFR